MNCVGQCGTLIDMVPKMLGVELALLIGQSQLHAHAQHANKS